MDFEELKQNAKKELEDAIQKQEELIKSLQRSFDVINKFDKGNVIIDSSGDYLLIVDTPVIVKEYLRVPIRHHIKPIIDADRCELNMSGCIDFVEISLTKMSSVEVISVREMFEKERLKLKDEFELKIKSSKQYIEKCQRVIEEKQKDIKYAEENIKKRESFDFDNNFEKIVDNYLESKQFSDDAYSLPPGYGKDYKHSSSLRKIFAI